MITRTQCKHKRLIQHTCIRSRASSQGYTFEACVLGADRVRSGSSGSQVGEEVVVHVSERDLMHPISPEATVVELGICSGTMRQLSWYLGSLDLPISVLVTTVVQGPRGTWVPVL